MLALVKAFLKAGVLTETRRATRTPPPARRRAASCPRCWPTSPCRCSMSTCTGRGGRAGSMSTSPATRTDVGKGLPNWRIVRYADDFVVLGARHRDRRRDPARGDRRRARPAGASAVSEAKTRVVHMSDGFDFLGFHIQWRRKRGTNKWYVYTFIADRPIRSVKAKIRALTHRTSQQPPRDVLIRLNQIHARLGQLLPARSRQAHLRRPSRTSSGGGSSAGGQRCTAGTWKDVRRRHTDHTGRWRRLTADGIELFNIASVPVTRYRYRGDKIPNPWPWPTTPDGRNRGEPVASRGARRVRRAAWGNGPGATPAPRPRPTQPTVAGDRHRCGPPGG